MHVDDEKGNSGLTEYAVSLAAAQKSAGKPVFFLGRKNGYAAAEAARRGIPAAFYSPLPSGFPAALKAARDFAPDVINAHTGRAHTLSVLIAAALRRKPAVIRTRADASPLKLKPFSRLLWKRTGGFIAANSNILEQFREVHGNRLARALIHQGMEIPFSPAQEKPSGVFRTAMVARFAPVKGHKTALEALAIAARFRPEIAMIFAGEEKVLKTGQLKTWASRAGVLGRVSFHGLLPDVPAFMRGCHAGLVASLGSEAVSRVALEWMSQAVPLIASRTGCLPDLVIDGQTGLLVEPGDAQSLAKALIALCENKQLAEEMGGKARERFLAEYTAGLFEKKTWEFYNEVVKNAPA